jgi:hypothetical protein
MGWAPHRKELFHSAKALGFEGPGFKRGDQVRLYKGSISVLEDEREIWSALWGGGERTCAIGAGDVRNTVQSQRQRQRQKGLRDQPRTYST